MERDESASTIPRGKLMATVKHDVERGPVCRIERYGKCVLAAPASRLAVTAVFRVHNQFLQLEIVETVRPAKILPHDSAIHGLSRQGGIVLCREFLWPQRIELIAVIHHDVNRAVVPRDCRELAQAGCDANTVI